MTDHNRKYNHCSQNLIVEKNKCGSHFFAVIACNEMRIKQSTQNYEQQAPIVSAQHRQPSTWWHWQVTSL